MDAGAIANWRMDAPLSETGHETALRTQGTEQYHFFCVGFGIEFADRL